jgi:CHASE3 domain sensor protein
MDSRRGTEGYSIETRIRLAGSVLAAVVAIGFVAFFVAVNAFRSAADQHARLNDTGARISQLKELVLDAQTGLRGFVLTGDLRFLVPWQEAHEMLPSQAQAFAASVADDPAALQMARDIQALAAGYLRSYVNPLVRLAQRDRARAAAKIDSGEGERRVDAMRVRFASLTNYIAAQSSHQDERARSAATVAAALGFGGASASLLLVTLCVVYLSRAVSRPIRRIASATEHFRAGDHVVRVPEEGPPEVSQLARAFNAMAASRSTARKQGVASST